MKITVKIASRGRPKELVETLNRWSIHASNVSNVEFIVSLDEDDSTAKSSELISNLNKIPNCKYFYGNHKSKIEAVNADMEHSTGDIIVVIADDTVCQTLRWDEIMIQDMQNNFPKFDGVLHYLDGIQNHALCTHPVMGREYFLKFGYIWHPSYKGLFCDNEFTEIARHLKKIAAIPTMLFEHDHPMMGNRKKDKNNDRDQKNFAKDQSIYLNRKRSGFDGIIQLNAQSKPQVLIVVISNGQWRAKTAGNITGLLLQGAYNNRNDFMIRGVMDEQCSIIASGRNHAIQQALAIPQLTHVLFIDSDATFPVTALKTLIDQNRDVIGCQALRRAAPYTPTGERGPDGKWILGCHFMLVKLSIFEKMKFPWFDPKYKENGDYEGEDQSFCRKVNEFSQVHCDEELSQQIDHLGEMNFTLAMHDNLQGAK